MGTVTGLANAGIYAPVGRVRLARGAHAFELRYGRAALSPGTGVPLAEIGTLAIAPPLGRRPVATIAPERYRSVCGRSLDWLEVIGS